MKENYEIDDEKSQINKLNFLISKYNIILNEYQIKYGNELFATLDKKLNKDLIDGTSNEFKKILIENVSLIREYEKLLLEKDATFTYLNNEINKHTTEIEKLVKENEELREENESIKEDYNKLYRNILDPENINNERYNVDSKLNWDYLKEENEKLLGYIEKSQYEERQLKNILSELKEKYSELLEENQKLNEGYNKYKTEYENHKYNKNFIEEKIKENCNQMILNEKKLNEAMSNYEKILIENKYLKQQTNQSKEALSNIENRKNLEIDMLIRDINIYRSRESEYKEKINVMYSDLSNLKFENNKIKQELQLKSIDNDMLTKLSEDTNYNMKFVEEKEKHIDMILKAQKKKVDEALLEKEISLVKQTLLEKQIAKINEDYSKLLNDKNIEHEQSIENCKIKYEQRITNKDSEISELKTENLSIKLERDKYKSEFNSTSKEYDKLFSNYKEEVDKYILKFEESEKNSFRNQASLQEKINSISRKNEQLEYDKGILEQELIIYKTNEKSNDHALERMNKNDEFLEKEILRFKEKVEIYSAEKDSLQKELDRKNNLYENKIRQMKEQYELKISILENAIKYQKDQFVATEDKALIMIKKQEHITDRFKEEFRNTVNYYESIIENLMRENKLLKKQTTVDEEIELESPEKN